MPETGEPRMPESGPPEEFTALLAEIDTVVWRIAWDSARRLDSEGCGQAGTVVADIYQEICLHLWRMRRRWRAEGDWTHWMAIVAKRKAIDIYRHLRQQKKVVSLDDPDWEFLKNVCGHDATVVDNAFAGAVRDCLKKLPERHREAFQMHHLHELSYEEIAKILTCEVGAVRVWVFRAREKLILCLAAKGIAGVTGGRK